MRRTLAVLAVVVALALVLIAFGTSGQESSGQDAGARRAFVTALPPGTRVVGVTSSYSGRGNATLLMSAPPGDATAIAVTVHCVTSGQITLSVDRNVIPPMECESGTDMVMTLHTDIVAAVSADTSQRVRFSARAVQYDAYAGWINSEGG